MTQPTTATNEIKNPLNAAQKILAELQGLTKEDQLLALRFASQTLRLELPAAAAPTSAPQTHATPALRSGERGTDIKSFTASKAPKSDQQFAAVVAYYHQFEAPERDRKAEIDADTMKDAARQAGRPQVKRWDATLFNSKNAGYLDSVGNGKFKLNAVGENLVAITLPGNGGAGSIGSTQRRKKSKASPQKKSSKRRT